MAATYPMTPPPPQQDDVDFALAIKRINDADQTIGANANGNSQNGNLGVSAAYDGSDGTVVQFRLSKKLATGNGTANGRYYKFNDIPVCVYNPDDANTCSAGDFPSEGWGYNKISGSKVLFKAPVLGATNYEYVLFLTKYNSDGSFNKDIIIDPKIKNGGFNLAMQKAFEPQPALVQPSDAGLSPMALVGSAILLVSLGVAIGLIANKA